MISLDVKNDVKNALLYMIILKSNNRDLISIYSNVI